MMLVEIEVNLL